MFLICGVLEGFEVLDWWILLYRGLGFEVGV